MYVSFREKGIKKKELSVKIIMNFQQFDGRK